MNHRRLLPDDALFPDCLRQIPDPPKQLFVMGDPKILAGPSLAIVGTRKPSPYGRQITTMLAGSCARAGITIISGLALGIDAIAHQAALAVQGRTVAVLASGIDQPTPVTNEWLARHILTGGGTVVSEYPPGIAARKHHFIARNRLVAGLSQAVLITEAAANSGSRHTADFALDQGKSVLAVPGNITSTNATLPNHLIKDGATPITEPNDIFLALGLLLQREKVMSEDDLIQELLFAFSQEYH